LGAWTYEGYLPGDQVLLRTKYDLEAHEGRYEYLTETVDGGVLAGEKLKVTAKIIVPEIVGMYWRCFKVVREGEKDFFCAFRYGSGGWG
jgi:hypothetical protein